MKQFHSILNMYVNLKRHILSSIKLQWIIDFLCTCECEYFKECVSFVANNVEITCCQEKVFFFK